MIKSDTFWKGQFFIKILFFHISMHFLIPYIFTLVVLVLTGSNF